MENQCTRCGNRQPQGGVNDLGTQCHKCGGSTIPAPQEIPGPDSPPPSDDIIIQGMRSDQTISGAGDDSHFGIQPEGPSAPSNTPPPGFGNPW